MCLQLAIISPEIHTLLLPFGVMNIRWRNCWCHKVVCVLSSIFQEVCGLTITFKLAMFTNAVHVSISLNLVLLSFVLEVFKKTYSHKVKAEW